MSSYGVYVHLDRGTPRPCGKGWEGTVGSCRRVKGTPGIKERLKAKLRARAKAEGRAARGAIKELAPSVASWSFGKVVGAAVSNVAIAHGIDPSVAQILSESASQSLLSVGLEARKKQLSPRRAAGRFISEVVAVAATKQAIGWDDGVMGGDPDVLEMIALATGKNASSQARAMLNQYAETVGNLITGSRMRLDSANELTKAEREAITMLAIYGIAKGRLREDGENLLEHLDVGKNCGARSKPCGESCIPRKRNCRKATSGIAQEANQKNRAKEIGRLKAVRDQRRKSRYADRKRREAKEFAAKLGFNRGSRFEKLRRQEEGRAIAQAKRAGAVPTPEFMKGAGKALSQPKSNPRDMDKAVAQAQRQGMKRKPSDRKIRKTSRGGTTFGGLSIDSADHWDSNPHQAKRIRQVAGLTIGVTHGAGEFLPGDDAPLLVEYGWVQGGRGLAVGDRALKAYIGPNLASSQVYLAPVMDGDEPGRLRLIVGVDSAELADAIATSHISGHQPGSVIRLAMRGDSRKCKPPWEGTLGSCTRGKEGGTTAGKRSLANIKRGGVKTAARKQRQSRIAELKAKRANSTPKGGDELDAIMQKAQAANDRFNQTAKGAKGGDLSLQDLEKSERMLRKSYKATTGKGDYDKAMEGLKGKDISLEDLSGEDLGKKLANFEGKNPSSASLGEIDDYLGAQEERSRRGKKAAGEIEAKWQERMGRGTPPKAVGKAKNQRKPTKGALKGKGAELAKQIRSEIRSLQQLGSQAKQEADFIQNIDDTVLGRNRAKSKAAQQAQNAIRRFRRKADAMGWTVETRLDALEWALEAIAK